MTRTRLTAGERHERLLTAAVAAFARGGCAGTTADRVVRLAGVSQPYVIRLAGSKQALFLAALTRATDRVEQCLRDSAAERADAERLGAAYDDLLAERVSVAVLLHGFVAGADPAIRPTVRGCLARIYRTVRELTGADEDEACRILAMAMLVTTLSAMRIIGPDSVAREPWMTELIGGLDVKRTGSLCSSMPVLPMAGLCSSDLLMTVLSGRCGGIFHAADLCRAGWARPDRPGGSRVRPGPCCERRAATERRGGAAVRCRWRRCGPRRARDERLRRP
ncbi:TetR/AcrR family transcriptional regulator [Couchioplanes caeruleus]|uniref:TetR family transcriptional regulator n=1 Tax=Couchioplanes caeruleus TaxID=56438 RepID=A0A3N1GTU4_9ACTN|nr:TetR/AcrR family transcriptional regulator [Couchioplanes caeruleus]ROP33669.1 TetR family transcriptional regulator [Couchioplanes caeruleus]